MKTLHEKVAAKLEANPSLLQIPLENIDRWLAQGHTAPHRLEQWRDIITAAQDSTAGFAALLSMLRDQSEAAVHLKSFDPFPRVLSSEERREIIRQCAYAH